MPGNVPNPLFLLERWFWQRDVRDALIRAILSRQLCITLIALAAGAASAPFWSGGLWLLWFGCGAAVSLWNFYALVKFVQNMVPRGWNVSVLVRLLVGANIRLILSAGILLAAFVWGKASPSRAVAWTCDNPCRDYRRRPEKSIEKARLTGYRYKPVDADGVVSRRSADAISC